MEFLLLTSVLSVTFALPSGNRYDRDKVLRVYPQDVEQVNILKNLAKTTKIDAWTRDIVKKNPKRVSHVQIGRTAEGRPIYALKILLVVHPWTGYLMWA
ncbi:hypothetical protein NDU88_001502 [Pleurodeles waltl]|uniref:Peptidase M14 domain-containing protein n=1 Tax=Pleurodeles waltl TaxID=8319 RepID=A0AAV7LCZ5_PLEWA|nr:hypothetical protein NDU88_001502 [Pleurodeles waltl]